MSHFQNFCRLKNLVKKTCHFSFLLHEMMQKRGTSASPNYSFNFKSIFLFIGNLEFDSTDDNILLFGKPPIFLKTR